MRIILAASGIRVAPVLAGWAEANKGANYDEYVNRLGNLTLLEKPINIVASNDFFSKKLPEYGKSANYRTRSIAGLTTVGKNSSITRIKREAQAVLNVGRKNCRRTSANAG